MSQAGKSGVVLDSYQVVYRPLVTEKGTYLSERFNSYTFAVSPSATKSEIKAAVEDLWDVRVVKVRTQNRRGKPRRHKMTVGHTSDWKKAIVQLHEEDRISFF
ncbi:MAG: 50S ribosomal protein L23 [Planctomycetaceae bacterium]